MNLIWLGKYRSFFENLSLYTNVYGQAYTIQGFHGTSVPCSLAQIQVLEYILENEEENQKMSEVARRLGLSPSAFSKNVKKMMDKQLLENTAVPTTTRISSSRPPLWAARSTRNT